MSMECEFCKRSFSTKGILISHQKSAKYCLKLQNKNNENFLCNFCNKNFTSQYNLNEHLIICKEKQYEERDNKVKDIYIKEVNELKQQIANLEISKKYTESLLKEKNDYIEKLEARLEKFEDSILSKTEKKQITTAPNHTTNNTTIVINNNYLNLNDIPKMAAFLEEKLDKEVVAGGQKGLAFLLSNTVLKDKYKCVDPSRQNFEFTNELGEVERDVKAKKLTNALIKSDICSKSGEIGMELWKKEDGSTDSLRYEAHSKNVLEMINFTRDNSTFRSELSALTS